MLSWRIIILNKFYIENKKKIKIVIKYKFKYYELIKSIFFFNIKKKLKSNSRGVLSTKSNK